MDIFHKWLRLIVKTMKTNRKRTLLTVGAVSLALFIYIALETIMAALRIAPEGESREVRLVVLDHTGDPHNELPNYFENGIAQTNHVTAVTPAAFTVLSPGLEQGKIFLTFAIDPVQFSQIFATPMSNISRSQYKTFKQTKNGALVGREIMTRSGWQVGDIVVLKSLPDNLDLKLVICGEYVNRNGSNQQLESQIIIHYKFYDESKGKPAKVNFFWLRVDDRAQYFNVMQTLQERFRDAEQQITVETESSMRSKMNQLTATAQMVISAVSSLVLLTVLIVIANAIALSMRERKREIAVMKVIGFTPRNILWLMFAESVFTALFAGVLGTVAAYLFITLGKFSFTMILTFNFTVAPATITKGLVVSTALGVISGLIPAYQASRVRIIQTLRSL